MSDSVTMEISGLKELADKLRTMGADLTRTALKAGVRDAAKIVRDDARVRNPDDTGLTERAIYYKGVKKESNDHQQTFIVGVKTRGSLKAPYWRHVEFGTAEQPARPFLRPAFEANKSKLVEAISSRLSKRIKAYDKKQARLSR